MRKILTYILILFTALAVCPFARAGAGTVSGASVHTVDIGISPSVYKKLISDSANVSRKAYVAVDGGRYQQLEINTRGAFSRVLGQAMPSKKIPFRIKFRSAEDGSAVLKNTSEVFINSKMPFDLLGEYIALDIYALLGVPTPAHTFSFVRFNDQDVGLYLTVESVNAQFLEKHFEDGGRSLYKSTYDYVPSPYYDSVWFGGLEATIDRGSENIMRLLEALNRREGYADYFDMDEVLRYFACTAAMGGEGSLLTERNNFFLYDNNGKFVLIPWDLGTAFDVGKTENWIDCFYLDDYEDVKTPLFELIMADPAYKARYHEYLRQICDTFLVPERLHPYVTQLVETLTPYLSRDVSMFLNTPTTPQDLLTAREMQYSPLLYTLDQYYLSLTDQLDGKSTQRYFDPQSEELQITMTGEGIVSFLSEYSPKMDPQLPQKIQAGYKLWREAHLSQGIPDVYYEYGIAAAVFALGCVVLVLARSLPLLRGRKKRSAQKGAE